MPTWLPAARLRSNYLFAFQFEDEVDRLTAGKNFIPNAVQKCEQELKRLQATLKNPEGMFRRLLVSVLLPLTERVVRKLQFLVYRVFLFDSLFLGEQHFTTCEEQDPWWTPCWSRIRIFCSEPKPEPYFHFTQSRSRNSYSEPEPEPQPTQMFTAPHPWLKPMQNDETNCKLSKLSA